MISATYQLTAVLLTRHYDYVINAGISGSYHKELKIGTVVNVTSEQFTTLGVDLDDKLQTLFEAGFIKPNEFPYHNGALVNPGSQYIHDLPEVSGITSNTIRISRDTLPVVRKIFNPDVESTEGGAVFYVCLQQKIPFLQLRAISNYIEDDMSEWDIPLALENLRLALFSVLNRIITTTKVKEE
jgi:futalosine hydrolase